MKEIDLAGISLERPVMNGAGPIKDVDQVKEIAQSESAAIVVGSITIDERLGNEGRTYYANKDNSYSLNSKGLPNRGLEFYKDRLSEMKQIANDHNKPLILSVAGFSPDEYSRLIGETISRIDGLEINLGCPNVWGSDGDQKKIASFDPDLTFEILRRAEDEGGRESWLSVKLSPYSDPVAMSNISNIIEKSNVVNAVVTSNTFPNACAFLDDNYAIDSPHGLSGMSGRALKPIAMGQVTQLRSLLPDAIAVIGVGGVEGRNDVYDYMKAGATAVQITTAYINFGPLVFNYASV